jgi:hypothetical protein
MKKAPDGRFFVGAVDRPDAEEPGVTARPSRRQNP